MRVGIADQSVVCDPVEQALDCPGAEAESPHELGTGCQARAALSFVLEFTRISHRPTEIFLMQPLDRTVGAARPVIAFDQKGWPVRDCNGQALRCISGDCASVRQPQRYEITKAQIGRGSSRESVCRYGSVLW